MNRLTCKRSALLLAFALLLPNPAWALREEQTETESGLEEIKLALLDQQDPIRSTALVLKDKFADALGLSTPITPPVLSAAGLEEVIRVEDSGISLQHLVLSPNGKLYAWDAIQDSILMRLDPGTMRVAARSKVPAGELLFGEGGKTLYALEPHLDENLGMTPDPPDKPFGMVPGLLRFDPETLELTGNIPDFSNNSGDRIMLLPNGDLFVQRGNRELGAPRGVLYDAQTLKKKEAVLQGSPIDDSNREVRFGFEEVPPHRLVRIRSTDGVVEATGPSGVEMESIVLSSDGNDGYALFYEGMKPFLVRWDARSLQEKARRELPSGYLSGGFEFSSDEEGIYGHELSPSILWRFNRWTLEIEATADGVNFLVPSAIPALGREVLHAVVDGALLALNPVTLKDKSVAGITLPDNFLKTAWAMSADGKGLWVIEESSNRVFLLDPRTLKVRARGPKAVQILMGPDGKTVFARLIPSHTFARLTRSATGVEEGEVIVPLAEVDAGTVVNIQERYDAAAGQWVPVISGRLMDELDVAAVTGGIQVRRFRLEKGVPEAVANRENVYLVDLPVRTEREWILSPDALVINIHGGKGPESALELGGLMNAAREADSRVLRAPRLYHSTDPELRDQVFAIDTQL